MQTRNFHPMTSARFRKVDTLHVDHDGGLRLGSSVTCAESLGSLMDLFAAPVEIRHLSARAIGEAAIARAGSSLNSVLRRARVERV